MNKKERWIIAFVLLGISIMTIADLISDTKEGVFLWHVLMEGSVALMALVGVYFLVRGSFQLKHSLENEKLQSYQLQKQSEEWKALSKKYIEGLSYSIDAQLTQWGLTQSEKEVAFLLIKGFSLREIAEIRKTAEKTARAQSSVIYMKAGLTGRSQLSAFFLEDLLIPLQ